LGYAVATLEWQSKQMHAAVAANISCVSNIGHSDSTFIRLLSFSFSCAREVLVKQWATSINLVRARPCKFLNVSVTWIPGRSAGGQDFTEKDIKLAFQQFDVDNNGFLGASDISHIFMAIGEDLDDDMIDELIREADKDGDGQIAFAEFHRLVKELEKESLGGAAIEPMKDFSRKPKTMKLSSSDGSGDGSDSAGAAGGG
jgi:hypothetical protein